MRSHLCAFLGRPGSRPRVAWLPLLAIACAAGGAPRATEPPATSARTAAPAAKAAPDAEDDCTRVMSRLLPVMNELVAKAGRSFGEAERDAQVAQCRDNLARGKRDPMMDCVLGAADQAGVRTCFAKALEAYQAAVRGSRFGCTDAATCVAKAVELDQHDPEQATEAYYVACTQGSVEGCEQAGLRWMKQASGERPHPLDPQIVDSWRRSCELGGGVHGCGNLGSAYFFGLWGTAVDGDAGIRYWTKSCEEQGNKFICRKLAQAKAGQLKPGRKP